MATTEATRDVARRQRDDMTQLQVSHTLRADQKAWYMRLREEVGDAGRPFAVGDTSMPHEIWQALDLPYVVDYWYSGLVAARRQGAHYSNVLTQHGFHDGLNRYGSLGIGVLLDKDHPDKPWGGLPTPTLVAGSLADRAGRIMAEVTGAEYVGFEKITTRYPRIDWWKMSRWEWEDLETSPRIDAMVEQVKLLIAASERITGRKLDIDRLREIIDRSNEQFEYFQKVRAILARAPKLVARLGEVMSVTMGLQWHRGTVWARDLSRTFYEEIKHRADNEMWVCPNEQIRLMHIGTGIWQGLDFYRQFEEPYGAVFVRSNYLSIAADGYMRHYGKDPLRALVSRYVSENAMHMPGLGGAWASWDAREHRVDGAISIAGWWGGRLINRQLAEEGMPVLEFPVSYSQSFDVGETARLVGDFIERQVIPSKRG